MGFISDWWSKTSAEVDAAFDSPAPVKQKVNELTIMMRDGAVFSWVEKEWKEGDRLAPWRDFHKWWFAREQSEYFTFISDDGDARHTFMRRDIMRFRVTIKST